MELHKEERCWEMYKKSPASSSTLMRLGAEHPTCPEALNSTREVDREHQQEQCEARRMLFMGNKIRSSVHYATEEIGQDNHLHLQYTKHCCGEEDGNLHATADRSRVMGCSYGKAGLGWTSDNAFSSWDVQAQGQTACQ